LARDQPPRPPGGAAALTPVRGRHLELSRGPEHIRSVLRAAVMQAGEKMRRAAAAIGLLAA